MAAYAIGTLQIHNTDWQKEYGEKMPALIQKHGGKVLARSAAQVLEGNVFLHGVTVMIEFPTLDHAQAWYADPAHVPLKQLRNSGAIVDMQLVAGL